MSDSDSDVVPDNLKEIHDEIDMYKKDPKTAGMFVSGWDDADVDVNLVKNPKESPSKHILWAAENGDLTVINELLDNDPSLVNVKDSDGYTPLHRAAYSDHVEVISCLLSRGADVTSSTEMGWTPLHSAANWNNYRSVMRLIHAGADINAKSDGDQTPLHLASAISHSRSTLLLLLNQREIIPDNVNKSGETAQLLAQTKGRYGSLFDMVDPSVCYIKSKQYTDNPFLNEHNN